MRGPAFSTHPGAEQMQGPDVQTGQLSAGWAAGVAGGPSDEFGPTHVHPSQPRNHTAPSSRLSSCPREAIENYTKGILFLCSMLSRDWFGVSWVIQYINSSSSILSILQSHFVGLRCRQPTQKRRNGTASVLAGA